MRRGPGTARETRCGGSPRADKERRDRIIQDNRPVLIFLSPIFLSNPAEPHLPKVPNPDGGQEDWGQEDESGEVFWFHDVRDPLNRSRRVAAFHTPAALQEMLGRDFTGVC